MFVDNITSPLCKRLMFGLDLPRMAIASALAPIVVLAGVASLGGVVPSQAGGVRDMIWIKALGAKAP